MSDWALITGASSGIGWELAELFAADHFNLVLVARNEDRLNQLAAELRARHGVEVQVIVKDLSLATAPQELFDALRATPVAILVNNAGSGWHGAFAATPLEQALAIMHLNMEALVRLTHLFVQPMRARRMGKILNVASIAAFQPGPMVNVYYASKAFVHNFSYALAVELEGSGVTVTTLCPGTTQTEFFARGNFGRVRAAFTMPARVVAEAGYRGLMRGRRVVIPGVTNQLVSALARRLPVRWVAAIAGRLNKSVAPKS